ncbi:MAG TPA: AfsR/SARP family transcriptional regulator [Gaiellaceae bacterium]|nr:AfsR/SARP family transcriptional regulator [Gaiellaceae bacterium]
MDFRILGPLEVVDGDHAVVVPGIKERSVLAILLLHANELVPADRLIDELWNDEPPATARKSLQVRVANLRKALRRGGQLLVTQSPGYVLRLESDQLDLRRFERLVGAADGLESGAAAAKLRDALALWRGAPLADLGYEEFAQGPIARLEEVRLATLEKCIDAELSLGLHADLVRELEELAALHPLRERLRALLMLALYRSGRQADALGVYRETRRVLDEELGLEPGPALQRLERAVLAQDPTLELEPSPRPVGGPVAATNRSILVALRDPECLDSLVAVAEPIALRSSREVILVRTVGDEKSLAEATASLHRRRQELLARGLAARAAAFTSTSPADDVVRTVAEQDVDLLVVDAPPGLLDDETLARTLARAACDVAVLVGGDRAVSPGPVLVPFGGADHDWAAVELAARITGADERLWLAGLSGERSAHGRDASRLLASVSLAIQRALGVAAEPLLVPPGSDGLVRAADGAALVVVGLSDRWQKDGLGPVRRAVAQDARPPVLLVRRGLRPGVLAPPESMTRFTWTIRAG